jgi:predicted Fe-Mo cluster-binding NifX family protein
LEKLELEDKDMVKKIMRDSLAGVLNALNADETIEEAKKCDAVLMGSIGGDAKTALAASGIKLFGGVSGDADQAVKNCECCIDLYMD